VDHLDHHVCGSLPVTKLIMFVTRCHHHEAWVLDSRVQTQHDANPAVLAECILEFGPFDSIDYLGREVARVLRSHLAELRVATIVPGEQPETPYRSSDASA
jgi:hypothetical protein